MCVFLCTTQYSACVFVVANGVVWVVIHTHLLHFLILEYSSRIKYCSLLRKWIVTLNFNQKFVLLILYSYFFNSILCLLSSLTCLWVMTTSGIIVYDLFDFFVSFHVWHTIIQSQTCLSHDLWYYYVSSHVTISMLISDPPYFFILIH